MHIHLKINLFALLLNYFVTLGPIKFLTNALDKSLKFSHHRYLGFSAAELAEGLTQIAVNDSNKKTVWFKVVQACQNQALF